MIGGAFNNTAFAGWNYKKTCSRRTDGKSKFYLAQNVQN